MRILLLHPTFPESFWSFGEVLKLVGRKALNPPLGLITVAAMLPKDWSLRLVDCAVRAPDEDDWTFADIVFLTGMIVQKPSMMDLIAQAKKRGIPIVVGGPYATSVPQDFVSAGVDYLVLDEAEISLAPFLAHLESAGAVPKAPDAPTLRFDAKGQKPELTETPVPRFDLLEFAAYDAMAVQYSRGCPFLCEFCDIITLYGRRPRTKTPAQILAELDCLHALGWRGGIFLVDDNFIGNKPNVKKLLPELSAWQEAHGFPFWLDTEASIDLAADIDLMAAMVQANFASVFIGIETPDEASLDLTRKHQNNRVPMLESLDLITRSGLRVMCGMIIGFDNEPSGAGQRIVEFVERAAIPTVGLSMLQVLPNTGLWTRLNREGRLLDEQLGIGQVNLLNFVPTRPVTEIGQEYVDAYRQLYDPVRYLDRTARHFQRLGLNPPFDLPPRPKATAQPRRTMRQVMAETANYAVMVRALAIVVWRQGVLRPSRGRFWRNLWSVIRTNPNRFGTYLAVCAHAEHFIPLTAIITRELEASLAQLDLEGGPARQIASTSPPLLRKPSRVAS